MYRRLVKPRGGDLNIFISCKPTPHPSHMASEPLAYYYTCKKFPDGDYKCQSTSSSCVPGESTVCLRVQGTKQNVDVTLFQLESENNPRDSFYTNCRGLYTTHVRSMDKMMERTYTDFSCNGLDNNMTIGRELHFEPTYGGKVKTGTSWYINFQQSNRSLWGEHKIGKMTVNVTPPTSNEFPDLNA